MIINKLIDNKTIKDDLIQKKHKNSRKLNEIQLKVVNFLRNFVC
jgi:hypothetical protein